VVRSIVIPNVVRDPYCDQMHGFIRDLTAFGMKRSKAEIEKV